MSTPALKPRPSARNTTTRVPCSWPSLRTVSASANQPATGRALTGGLSMTTSAIPPGRTLALMAPDAVVTSGRGRHRRGYVQRGHVAECDSRPDRGSGAGVLVAHHRRRAVARRVQARDRSSIGSQHAGVLVGQETAFGAEV